MTWWKVTIPVLTVVIFLIGSFHGGNFTRGGGFFVHGAALKSVLIAIPNGGIVFSLTGFEQAIQLGGEAKDPRDIPRAVVGSVLIGAAIYVLVQLVFVAALDPALLAKAGGWTGLANPAHSSALVALKNAPFYQVASVAGITWWAVVLRIDAVISPPGTGLIYTAGASRMLYGLSRNGFVPGVFGKTSSRKVPLTALLLTAVIGVLFMLPFPSWSKLVSIVSSAAVLMYASAPLALGALRLQKPDLQRPYLLPAAKYLAPLAFVFANWMILWAGWQTITTLMFALLVGYALLALSRTLHLNTNDPRFDWRAIQWVIPFLLGALAVSYFSGFGAGGIFGGIGVFRHVLDHGGNNDLGLYGGLAASAAWSLVVYFWALRCRLPEAEVDELVGDDAYASGHGEPLAG